MSSQEPNIVQGSARGINALRGAGDVTNIPRVPNGSLGYLPTPKSARSSCAAAKTPTPQKLVGRRLPASRYRHLLFSMPTPCSAVAFAFGSCPCVVVLCMA